MGHVRDQASSGNTFMNKFRYAFLLLLVTGHVACEQPSDQPAPQQSTNTQGAAVENLDRAEKSYAAKGVVLELDPAELSIFIHHEAIPGFMDEMTMRLKVADQTEYDKLKVGHEYTFKMIVDRERGTRTTEFAPTGHISVAEGQAELPSERWLQQPTFDLGDTVPEFAIESTTGETISPSTLRGKVWAITFIFTRCPLPDYCPLMTFRLKEAVDLLEQREINDWSLISLTIDPDHDQLTVLKDYRRDWGVDSSNWSFCRSELEQVRRIGDPLGLTFQADKFPIEHNLRTAVFDSEGRLVEVFSGNNWTAAQLVDSIENAAE